MAASRKQILSWGLLALIGAAAVAWYGGFATDLFHEVVASLAGQRPNQRLYQQPAILTSLATLMLSLGMGYLMILCIERPVSRTAWLLASAMLLLSAGCNLAAARINGVQFGVLARAGDLQGAALQALQSHWASRFSFTSGLAMIVAGSAAVTAAATLALHSTSRFRTLTAAFVSVGAAAAALRLLSWWAVRQYEALLATAGQPSRLAKSLTLLLLSESLAAVLLALMGVILMWRALAPSATIR